MQRGHDGFLIYDLPDGVAAAALAAGAGATDALGGLETHELFDSAQQAEIVRRAQAARSAYKPPTSS